MEMMFDIVDRRNPANQLNLVVFFSLFSRLFIHPRWLFRISSINSSYPTRSWLAVLLRNPCPWTKSCWVARPLEKHQPTHRTVSNQPTQAKTTQAVPETDGFHDLNGFERVNLNVYIISYHIYTYCSGKFVGFTRGQHRANEPFLEC